MCVVLPEPTILRRNARQEMRLHIWQRFVMDNKSVSTQPPQCGFRMLKEAHLAPSLAKSQQQIVSILHFLLMSVGSREQLPTEHNPMPTNLHRSVRDTMFMEFTLVFDVLVNSSIQILHLESHRRVVGPLQKMKQELPQLLEYLQE